VTLLGIKWSPIAVQALDLVDCVEVAGWSLDGAPRSHPLLLHNIDLDFSLARPGAIDDAWIVRARSMIAETGTPWLSLHLGFSAEEVYFEDHMLPRSAVLDRQICRARFLDALRVARDGIGVPLLLENLDYCPEGAYEHICDPAFVRDVVEALDCSVLLDLAHAQVSADWLDIEIEDYLDALPLKRVVQIHLSSPRRVNGRLDDCHYELLARDYSLLERVLRECNPRAVVLEYTRDQGLLCRQLTEVRQIIECRT
jgi:uncharacterized protein